MKRAMALSESSGAISSTWPPSPPQSTASTPCSTMTSRRTSARPSDRSNSASARVEVGDDVAHVVEWAEHGG